MPTPLAKAIADLQARKKSRIIAIRRDARQDVAEAERELVAARKDGARRIAEARKRAARNLRDAKRVLKITKRYASAEVIARETAREGRDYDKRIATLREMPGSLVTQAQALLNNRVWQDDNRFTTPAAIQAWHRMRDARVADLRAIVAGRKLPAPVAVTCPQAYQAEGGTTAGANWNRNAHVLANQYRQWFPSGTRKPKKRKARS